ncbi:BatD family protein [Marichromatium gracile]|uniref:BatD family protein n=1 Tax=Marichromatium gracile TaxID=1048 RepID=UPI001F3C47D2|nr:BatD family protein [Marichromatium gracile]MCF1184450.1 BatD family protein [Marichromatium gracile]
MRPWSPILLILLLVGCSLGALAQSAELRLDLERQRLALNETLVARLIAEGGLKGEPDLRRLEQDFEVLERSHAEQMRIINGTISRLRVWTLVLAPRHPGVIEIAPIALGAARTEPRRVEVVEAGARRAAEPGAPPLARVEAEVETATPYVQQALVYRVAILLRERPLQAALSAPLAEGAIVEPLGEDRSARAVVDGVEYTKVERRYLLIPQHSGTLRVEGPRLDVIFAAAPRPGALYRDFPSLSGFGAGGGERRLVERAETLTLQVRARPDAAAEPWLPASAVRLREDWAETPPRAVVGEPLTRVLTLEAEGASATQLPELVLPEVEGAQRYPGRPRVEDGLAAGEVRASARHEIALIPTRPGPLHLPEVRLAWWDLVNDRPREAVIPARTLEVAPAPGVASRPPSTAVEPPAPALAPAGGGPAPPGTASGGPWPWIALVLGLGWATTLLRLWWRRRAGGEAPVAPPRASVDLGTARARVEAACRANDPRAARAALLDWGRARWGARAPAGPVELGRRLGRPGLGATLAALERALYAATGEPWDGAGCWARLAPALTDTSTETARATPLAPLYPGAG